MITVKISHPVTKVSISHPDLKLNFPKGVAGHGVPVGGSEWDFLVKTSGVDYATAWKSFVEFLETVPEYKDDDEVPVGVRFYRIKDGSDVAKKGTLIFLG